MVSIIRLIGRDTDIFETTELADMENVYFIYIKEQLTEQDIKEIKNIISKIEQEDEYYSYDDIADEVEKYLKNKGYTIIIPNIYDFDMQ